MRGARVSIRNAVDERKRATSTLRSRNLLMLPLLLGAAAVCVIGAYLGIRRITR
jgi:hypothetical protein